MKRFFTPFPIAAFAGVLALVGLLAYGLSQNEPDRGIESAIARGKVVVLNFWASWCKPCREESPLLDRWHEKISTRGGTVLGVNVLDEQFMRREVAPLLEPS